MVDLVSELSSCLKEDEMSFTFELFCKEVHWFVCYERLVAMVLCE